MTKVYIPERRTQWRPPHPGTLIKLYILPDLGLTVGEAAQDLGIHRTTLSQLLNRRRDVTVGMAYKLDAWLNGDGQVTFTAKTWLTLQAHYDSTKYPPETVAALKAGVTERQLSSGALAEMARVEQAMLDGESNRNKKGEA